MRVKYPVCDQVVPEGEQVSGSVMCWNTCVEGTDRCAVHSKCPSCQKNDADPHRGTCDACMTDVV